jgi:hypothetical protein
MYLGLTACLFTCASWFYLHAFGIPLVQPNAAMAVANLPTDFPSIWHIVSPSPTATSWLAPLLILLIQVFLTGGLYGSLVRANLGQAVGAASFVSDGLRSFWRLVAWNLLWTALYLVLGAISGLGRGLPQAPLVFGIPVLILRFIFLFSDVALVCEQQSSVSSALRRSVRALFTNFVPMIPYAIALTLLSDIAVSLSTRVGPSLLLAIGLVYTLAVTWLLHMLTARYLYFSQWTTRANDQAVSHVASSDAAR